MYIRISSSMTIAAALMLTAALILIASGSASANDLHAAAAQEPQGRPGQPIIISWSTETEVNTAGFNVYRALHEDGPWEKINPRLVPASPDPMRGGSYVFTDTNVIAGITYWYELEEVELGGRTIPLERTQATARSGSPFAGLPCASGLAIPLAFAVGMAVVGRTRSRYGLS